MIELAVEIGEEIKKLENELSKYEEKQSDMIKQYTETRAGSAYGVEYFEIQVKVYQSMIADIKKELSELKRKRMIK